jgi:hypothetical protein
VSAKRLYANGGISARAIVDDQAYEVDGRQPALLERGKRPADLV